jgi:hypothetical protein
MRQVPRFFYNLAIEHNDRISGNGQLAWYCDRFGFFVGKQERLLCCVGMPYRLFIDSGGTNLTRETEALKNLPTAWRRTGK